MLPTPKDCVLVQPTVVVGQSGATLSDIVPHVAHLVVQEQQQQQQPQFTTTTTTTATTISNTIYHILIVCAGENDIGNGSSLRESVRACQQVLDTVLDTTNHNTNSRTQQHWHVVLLGPKLEPWLQHDPPSRKHYIQLSRALERTCQQFAATHNGSGGSGCHFVECLLLFCGDTAHGKGALLGGQAIPQGLYFDTDQLHLSLQGYQLWNTIVEESISKIVNENRKQKTKIIDD